MCGNPVVFDYDEWHLQKFFQVKTGSLIRQSSFTLSFHFDGRSSLKTVKREFEEGRIGKFFHPRGTPLVSHLLYVDDMLVF